MSSVFAFSSITAVPAEPLNPKSTRSFRAWQGCPVHPTLWKVRKISVGEYEPQLYQLQMGFSLVQAKISTLLLDEPLHNHSHFQPVSPVLKWEGSRFPNTSLLKLMVHCVYRNCIGWVVDSIFYCLLGRRNVKNNINKI